MLPIDDLNTESQGELTMKKFLLGGAVAAALALGGPALAADMPVKAAPVISPVVTWSGFYFGGSIGAAWMKPDAFFVPSTVTTSAAFPTDTSWIGGLHTGYNWQFGHIVLGTETNYLFTDLNSSIICPTVVLTCTTRVQNIFMTGGRLGFAWNNLLLYGAGGYSRTQWEQLSRVTATGLPNESAQSWHDGWYAGGGVEWAFTPSIWLGVDYTHVEVNRRLDIGIPATVPTSDRSQGGTIDMVRAKISFKLWEGMFGPFSR